MKQESPRQYAKRGLIRMFRYILVIIALKVVILTWMGVMLLTKSLGFSLILVAVAIGYSLARLHQLVGLKPAWRNFLDWLEVKDFKPEPGDDEDDDED